MAGTVNGHHRGFFGWLGHVVKEAFADHPRIPVNVRFTAAADQNHDGFMTPDESQWKLQTNTGVRIPINSMQPDRVPFEPAADGRPALATVRFDTIEREFKQLQGLPSTEAIYDITPAGG